MRGFGRWQVFKIVAAILCIAGFAWLSLAYLIPAILYALAQKKKAVVSTHTINLQEQLTEKDLPMLAHVLPVKFSFAMLKGRGNYLCSRRLHKAMQQSDSLFTSPENA